MAPTTFHFRTATDGDAFAISALIADFTQDFFVHADGAGTEIFLESVSEKAEQVYIQDPRYHFILALEDEKLAGFIAMRDLSHLYHLFIATEFQGLGLARELWQRAQAFSTSSGHTGPFTVNSSVKAIPVYQRFGFVATGDLIEMHGIAFLPMRFCEDI
ncbi:GNAT family N-acetyltransferase [Undibacterium sp. Di27W]|uniref:GNAT family N-acetyltransferase n=1 Tax=Undibacterium sp. Di27W TaxID=3413036 RepID=UPI003BF430AB